MKPIAACALVLMAGAVAAIGTVPDPEARQRVAALAAGVDGVRTVENVFELALAEGATR